MKKKWLVFLCAILACLCAAFAITGCANNPDDGQEEHVHNYGEWVTTLQPTCAAAGSKVKTCSCGDTQTEAIPATGAHTESDWLIDREATVTEVGLKHKECIVCGATLATEEIPTIAPPIVTYTVTYSANGGAFADGATLLTQEEIEEGSYLIAPQSPTRVGYTFSGWATSAGGNTTWSFSNNALTQDTTLYAIWVNAGASIVSVEGGELNGMEIFMLVDHTTDTVSLSRLITVASGSTWRLYRDALGQTEIPTKIATGTDGKLADGDNVFYIVVTSADAYDINVYELTVHRSYLATVTYYAGISVYETESFYTGSLYTATVPEFTGYTFHGLTTAGQQPFTQAVLYAPLALYLNLKANEYLITYDVNGGDALSANTQTVVYDSSYTLPIPTRTGYTFTGWKTSSGVSYASGVWNTTSDVALVANWEINAYTVTLNTSQSGIGTVSGEGSYEYGSRVTVTASAYRGYVCLGWYQGDTLVTDEANYTFTLGAEDVRFTANFEVADEMKSFTFTSTATTCTVTGLKDKTATSIVIPDSVTSIGDEAFRGCSGLTSVTIGNSVTSIGSYAFV